MPSVVANEFPSLGGFLNRSSVGEYVYLIVISLLINRVSRKKAKRGNAGRSFRGGKDLALSQEYRRSACFVGTIRIGGITYSG